MTNDAFIALWTGLGGGIVLGIAFCAITIAIQNGMESRRSPNRRAIEVISKELHHCEFHIQDAGKSPEYYQEMQELIDAYNVAIDAMRTNGGGRNDS